MRERIGFVGLGLMGSRMVANLISAGFPVMGYDIDPDRATCLILVCTDGTEDRWAGQLTEAMLRPDAITGY